MAATYDIVQDYHSPDGALTESPFWVLAVVNFKDQMTLDRSALPDGGDGSTGDGLAEGGMLVISSDCTSLSIQASKNQHVYSLTATLETGLHNYLSVIYPGAWVMAWVVGSEDKGKKLIERIKRREPCNRWDDGLRFIGRAHSIRRNVQVNRQNATVGSCFNLQCVGFSEFDMPLFYEPLLEQHNVVPSWLSRFGLTLSKIVRGVEKSALSRVGGGIDVNKMMPAIVRLVLGEGAFKEAMEQLPAPLRGAKTGGYRVPTTVGKLLGRTTSAGGFTFSDLVDIIVGVQKYNTAGTAQNTPSIFVPDGLREQVWSPPNLLAEDQTPPGPSGYKFTGKPLLGEFPIQMIPLQFTPLWSIMGNYLNPAVNEMYIALKSSDEAGTVTPHLVVRQLPFSSEEAPHKVPVTKMLEVPRWRIDPSMVIQVDVGRSDALRFNFFHVQGTGQGVGISPTLQYVRNLPISDGQDIQRNGLRPFQKRVNCLDTDETVNAKRWRDIATDIAAGQHLTLQGTIQTVGILPPIAPGDNCEFEGVVYHIEGVSHVCGINGEGVRNWETRLMLSHGVAAEQKVEKNKQAKDADARTVMYAGVVPTDNITADTHQTVEDSMGRPGEVY